MSVEEAIIEEAGALLPLFLKWIGVARTQGKDPRAELEAMLDTADAAADAAERAKFGGT